MKDERPVMTFDEFKAKHWPCPGEIMQDTDDKVVVLSCDCGKQWRGDNDNAETLGVELG